MGRIVRQASLNELIGHIPSGSDPVLKRAAELSATSSFNDGLAPYVDEDGELVFFPRQGLKAAAYARQDAAASIVILSENLALLRSLRRIALASFVVLLYVAYRLT